jgi:hypothetical protein
MGVSKIASYYIKEKLKINTKKYFRTIENFVFLSNSHSKEQRIDFEYKFLEGKTYPEVLQLEYEDIVG